MKDPQIAITFPATEIGVRKAMRAIMRRLGRLYPDENILAATEITVAEAVNNIVEHGYAGMTPRDISVRLVLLLTGIRIEITDSGSAYPGGMIPAATAHDLSGPTGDLPEGGFGWMLIHRLTSDIRYERSEGENRLYLAIDCDTGGMLD